MVKKGVFSRIAIARPELTKLHAALNALNINEVHQTKGKHPQLGLHSGFGAILNLALQVKGPWNIPSRLTAATSTGL